MGKKNRAELEKKDIILYKGDWADLAAILKPRRITPTVFIRELVHRKLLQIKSATQDTHNTLELPDVLADTDLTTVLDPSGHDESADEGEPSQP